MIKKNKKRVGVLKNKHGLSEVVSIVLFLALVVVMVGLVWMVVNNLVKDKLSSTGSCFDTAGKVSINSRYTCYNSSSNEFQFSISLGDLDVEEVLIGFSSVGTSESFTITNVNSTIENVVSYPSRNVNVTLPKKNGGLTYLFDMDAAGFSGTPDSIRIAPVIDGNQCETSDTLNQIDDCQSLVQ